MNRKQKKTSFIVTIIVLSILIIISITIIIVQKVNSPINQIEKKWNIKLPKNISIEYHKNNIGWFGEGERYTVFKLKDEPTDFILDFVSLTHIETTLKDTLPKMNIPNKYLPDWESRCLSKFIGSFSSSRLFMLYCPDSKMLFIYEDIY